MASKDDLITLLPRLSTGLEALWTEFREMWRQNEYLERRLKTTTEECESLRRLFPESTVKSVSSTDRPYGESTADKITIPDNPAALFTLHEGPYRDNQSMFDNLKKINRGFHALNEYKTIKSSTGQHQEDSTSVEEQEPQPRQSVCPFASMGNPNPIDNLSIKSHPPPPESTQRRAKRASFNDPIGTVQKPIRAASPAPSDASGPACPIRFLDQHSPEDIAKYFEEHKHELPRSHELCVKRFQANSDSIRELDAKYGNLVAMIQGLGQKHQPMLPSNPDPENLGPVDEENGSERKIKDWAHAVTDEAVTDGENPKIRQGHFEKDLKDVRVGESPSRPWGVPIPSKYLDAADHQETFPGKKEPFSEEKKCPIDHTQAPAAQTPKSSNKNATGDQQQPVNQQMLPNLESGSVPPDGSCIVNHDLVLVAGRQTEKKFTVYNYGTVILGYENETARHIVDKIRCPAHDDTACMCTGRR